MRTIFLLLAAALCAQAQIGALIGRDTLLLSGTCQITTTVLAPGTINLPYSQTLGTTGCISPVSWTISAGTLCTGLSLNGSTGLISGTPTVSQTCSFTATATDTDFNQASQPLSIAIYNFAFTVGGKTTIGGMVTVGK